MEGEDGVEAGGSQVSMAESVVAYLRKIRQKLALSIPDGDAWITQFYGC